MQSIDETVLVTKLLEWSKKNYNCSQIMALLILEKEGRQLPDLVRAMEGLGDGCGFFQETCGIMTGAACMISWYAGKGGDSEKPSRELLPMLEDFNDWFQQECREKFKGTRCKEIVGEVVGTTEGKMICGALIIQAYKQLTHIFTGYKIGRFHEHAVTNTASGTE